jgi:hypothetical protein
MKPVKKSQLQLSDVVWTHTTPIVLAHYQNKQLTAYFVISQTASVNRFQVWDGLEMVIETKALVTAIHYYNSIGIENPTVAHS